MVPFRSNTAPPVGVSQRLRESHPLQKRIASSAGALLSVLVLGAGAGCEDPFVGWPSEDTVAPTVTATTPTINATNVPLSPFVSATFSEAMDPASISADTLVLDRGTTRVSGRVTYVGVTAVHIPIDPLLPETQYTATVTRGVRDLAGNALEEDRVWSFTTGTELDDVRPQVSATEPPDGADSIALNRAISATFTEAIDPRTLDATTFLLSDGTTDVAGAVTYVGIVATFRPADRLTADTTYSARITDTVADIAGNQLAEDYVWTFTTGAFDDTTAPEVASTLPSRGELSVALNAAVSATFTEAMDPATLSNVTFTVVDSEDPVLGTVVYSGITATFLPDAPFDTETLYTATITAGARDLAGNALVEDYMWTFISGNGVDDIAPRVTFTSPPNGATSVAFDTSLSAAFSEAMRPETVSSSTFVLFDGPELVLSSVSYTGVTAVLEPSEPLDSFTTYTARISTGVEDLAGNAMLNEFVWSFTTGLVPDTTAPIITSTSPAAGELLVPMNTRVTATFSEPMAPLTMHTGNFVLFDGPDAIAGAVTYTGVVATFTPAEALDPTVSYTASVKAEVTDLAGNPMGVDYTWVFQTGPIPDDVRPRVTLTAPNDSAMGMPINHAVVAIFTETMDAATITTANFTVRQLDTVIVGTVSYNGVTATFRPSTPFEPLTNYTATVTTSARDLAGNGLLQNYVWDFRTGITQDITRPSVSVTQPGNNQTGVALNTAVVVAFSEAMDAATIGASSFRLTDNLSVVVEGAVSGIGSNAIFVPTAPLHENTAYTGTITIAATDLAGNALRSVHEWTFTTGTLPDTTPLVVSLFRPSNAASNVPRNTTISARFSERIQPMSLHNLRFRLDGPGATSVEGTVRLHAGELTATFVPTTVLLPATQYTATLSADVKDLSGNGMLLDRTWTFLTGTLADGLRPVSLGTLQTFVALAETGFTNSNDDGTTVLDGDLGVAASASCISDGAPCSAANLSINGGRYEDDLPGVTTQARADLFLAYMNAIERPPGTIIAELAGQTLTPGVYTAGSDLTSAIGGVLVLDGQGDANAVWIFQAGTEITINNDAQVSLTNGARAENVFWVTATSLTLGSNVSFAGTVLAQQSVSVGTGSNIVGRLLCLDGAINLATNTLSLPPM